MIDPLRPYWPTNRSIAGLLLRTLLLLAAVLAVAFEEIRRLGAGVVLVAATGQASLLVIEWMELRRTGRTGLMLAGILGFVFLFLAGVLVIESRSVLVLSVRR